MFEVYKANSITEKNRIYNLYTSLNIKKPQVELVDLIPYDHSSMSQILKI